MCCNEGGGGGRSLRGPLVLRSNATEQRVSGGRLFIQNARSLHTKVMSNGVEVIVRGKELLNKCTKNEIKIMKRLEKVLKLSHLGLVLFI
jgi:hypothetical protein